MKNKLNLRHFQSRLFSLLMIACLLVQGMAVAPVHAQTGEVNLTPFTPDGWSNPIVASSIMETHINDTLYDARYTYVDWAVTNAGGIASAPFKTCLYYDKVNLQCWDNEPLNSGQSMVDKTL